MHEHSSLTAIPDDELLERLGALLQASRRTEADLVAHIGEVDRRRLYARAAVPSMFAYCTEVLHLSEAEAYLRIAAARAARQHPQLLAMLGDGRLHLSAIAKLAPHLTPQNCDTLLRRATHRSKRQVEELLAEIAPRPDVPSLLRKLPERAERSRPGTLSMAPVSSAESEVDKAAGTGSRDAAELGPDGVVASTRAAAAPLRSVGLPHGDRLEPNAPSPRPVVMALAPSRYKVQFTASAELCDKLERLQALMSTELPGTDLAAVIDHAVSQTLQRLEARRYARTSKARTATASPVTAGAVRSALTRPVGRRIPAAVRRAVFERDGGRCHYRDEAGRRCTERHRLEYHHLHPFAMGGGHEADNVRLMCRAHNIYLAEHDYGHRAMTAGCRRTQQLLAPTASSDTT